MLLFTFSLGSFAIGIFIGILIVIGLLVFLVSQEISTPKKHDY